ncbi:SDR family oxidoreductase [Roseomonas sp. NAR14]|uniref:SDR family oxidoreductase n=1 Tax=Roseomonas acroporae TaxID=2937791 RepID=A0A9X1Y5F8_9PROT|nr:SDR family oxidoreductase [Roseomonas acroporae]MCK8783457.1 SDR family oxidoreductase [Roseomonas acroporae]
MAPTNPFDLTGRAALVTGGNGGIGLGMVLGLAAAGADVVIAGRDRAKNAEALAAVESLGRGRAAAIEADLAGEAACHALVREAAARFGRLDVLIHNAGITKRVMPEQLALADWNAVLHTNLTAALLLAQAAYPEFLKAGRGKIVTIGSMMSIFGAPYAAAYAASKGGIVQLTRSLATAWAKDNIQCNAILPGWIDTALTRGAREQVEGLNERVLARTPAGRWGRPQDLAGLAVFLSAPASDFVTGTAIPVDGGYSVS